MTGGNRQAAPPLLLARIAGVLYLAIIAFGLFGELFVRSGLVDPGDASATAANLLAAEGLFRLGFLADSIMVLCDVALAVLLYVLLRPVGGIIALMAMCFRLAQAAVIALNLLNYYAAILVLGGSGYASGLGIGERDALALLFLDLHSHGYDLGLLLFGLSCLLTGYLVYRSGFLPKALGVLLAAAAVSYLVGSYTRFLFPEHVQSVTPIYLVAIVAELSLCLWLLVRGVDAGKWERAVSNRRPSGS